MGFKTFEGEDTPRTEVVRHFARNASPLDKVASAYKKRPTALVHYSQDSLRHLLYFEPMDRANEILHGIHRQLDEEGFQIRFVTDWELLADLPDATRLVLPISPLLSPQAQQAIVKWQSTRSGRELWLGPDTGLLDYDGNWLRRENRPLWLWLGVEPRDLCDMATTLQVGDQAVNRFRVFDVQPSARVLSSAPWRGRKIPVRIECRPGVFLHAYDWTRTQPA